MAGKPASRRLVRNSVALSSLIALSACTGSAAVPAEEDPFGSNWNDRAVFEEALVETSALEGLAGASVYHLDVVVNRDLDVLEGREWIRYTNQESEQLEEIYFQLFANVTGGSTAVSSVSVGGESVVPVVELSGQTLRVPLSNPLLPGDAITLQLDFTVQLSQDPETSYGVLGHFDDFLLLDGFYPVVLVYDDEGWNVEDLVPIGDATYLDSSFFLVRMTAPRDLDLVASGTEIQRDRVGRSQVVSFAIGPARDFYLAAAPDLEVFSSQTGQTDINSYGRSQEREGAERALQFAVDAMALFGERLGPYQYPEFDMIGTPMRALGIEYPGATTISIALYDLDAEVSGLPAAIVLESTVAHEMAHQWFYNLVGNDQIDEPWLDEALAQYLTGLYYREIYGDQAEQDYRQSWTERWDRIDGELIPIGLPTNGYTPEQYSPIVYGRGPLFLAALEDQMGRDSFAVFVRDYYQSNIWGIVTGNDFLTTAERHCQCDLSEMFEEWVGG
jgi:hypothetical protein